MKRRKVKRHGSVSYKSSPVREDASPMKRMREEEGGDKEEEVTSGSVLLGGLAGVAPDDYDDDDEDFDKLCLKAVDDYDLTQISVNGSNNHHQSLNCDDPDVLEIERKEGEIKVLRETIQEKDKELQLKSKEIQDVLTQYKFTEEMMRQQFEREKKSLEANVTFLTKELADITEKYRNISQPNKRTWAMSLPFGRKRTRYDDMPSLCKDSSLPDDNSKGCQTDSYTNQNHLVISETSGGELAILLLNRDQLFVPDYNRLEVIADAHSQEEQPNDTTEAAKSLGLLSLLQLPPVSQSPPKTLALPSRSHAKTPLITPINKRCLELKGELKNSPSPFRSNPDNLRKSLSLDSNLDKSYHSNPTTPNSSTTTAAATSNNITTSIVASNSLQRGLCELLGTSSSVFTHTPKMPHFSIESAATYSMSLIQSKSNIGVSLLHPLDSELSRYLQRQISRREKKIIMNQINDNQLDISIFTESNNDVDLSQSSLTPTCSNCSSGSDASSGSYSIKSNSSNTATCSSKDTMSSDYVMENKTIIQMAHSLESLCKYSRDVREVILLQPHKMNLSDSVISCDEEENMNEGTDDYNITDYSFTTPDQATELSSNLIPFNKSGNRSPRLDKFFLKTTQEYYFTNDHVCGNTSRLSYTGTSLLDTLFGLINNLFWKEDYELLLSVVETLSILAHYCPDELLYKFSPLINKDSVLVSLLLLEKSEMTVKVLDILTSLVTCPHLITSFCSNSNNCILDHCYALYVPRLPVTDPGMKIAIESKLTKFLNMLSHTEEGMQIMCESDCCSHQLMKSLVCCLSNLLKDLNENSQDDVCKYKLAQDMKTLLYTLCNNDTNISSHKKDCFYAYMYCLDFSCLDVKSSLSVAPFDEPLQDLLDNESANIQLYL